MLSRKKGITTRTWAGRWTVLVVTAIILTGCITAKNPPVPGPATPTLFVDYQRTGGIAGMADRMVIFDNGVALVQSRSTSREIQLNKSDLERISAVFDAAQFAKIEGNYTSRRGGADLMQYSITYQGKTVITEDTAIPASLEPVIQEMDRTLSAGLGSRQVDLQIPAINS